MRLSRKNCSWGRTATCIRTDCKVSVRAPAPLEKTQVLQWMSSGLCANDVLPPWVNKLTGYRRAKVDFCAHLWELPCSPFEKDVKIWTKSCGKLLRWQGTQSIQTKRRSWGSTVYLAWKRRGWEEIEQQHITTQRRVTKMTGPDFSSQYQTKSGQE